nr:PAS domain S-box protein [Phyllobacterium myrsinacearum]
MTSGTYPFIDIAVLDEIREHFANGDALVVISPDLDSVIWANGQGASALGYSTIDDILDAGSVLNVQARRQLMALDGFPAIGHGRTVSLRVAFGLASRILTFQASDLTLPRGEPAILLSIANTSRITSEAEIATLAIKGFGDSTTHAAMIDASGKVLAASDQFRAIGFSDKILGDLVREVRLERNRLVKRPVQTSGGFVPTGIARLTDSPALHLLFAIEDVNKVAVQPVAIEDKQPEPPAEPSQLRAGRDAGESVAETAEPPRSTAAVEPIEEAVSDAVAEPAEQELLNTPPEGGAFLYKPSDNPARFVWKVDADARFNEVSPELVRAVGPNSASVIGKSFRDVAKVYGLDSSGEIADLLERRDTWSGRSVLWPIEGTDLRVPIELAALPIYSRERVFMGFRGFGVARMGDVTTDPEAIGKALAPEPAASADVFNGEKPAIAITPEAQVEAPREEAKPEPNEGNVIPLKTNRLPRDDGRLNDAERNAFREIAERLRREVLADNPKETDNVPAVAAADVEAVSGLEATDPTPSDPVLALVPDAEVVGPGFDASADIDAKAPTPEAAPEKDFAENIRTKARQGVDTAILAALPLPVLIHRHGILLYANKALLDATLYESHETINAAGGLNALFAENPEQSDDEDAEGMNLRLSNGTTKRVQAHLQAVRWDEDGERALLLALSPEAQTEAPVAPSPEQRFDDSERLLLQTRIDELNAILDTATDGVVLLDSAGAIRSVNHSAAALFGYEPEEVEGKAFSLLFAIESQRTAMDYVSSLSDNGVASVLNDGREVIGRESKGRFIPLFMTIGKLDASKGFCVVLRDITHWKQAEEELLSAKREAERTSSQKSEFLARISHEIRTPLNAIIGFSELMADEKFGPIGSERYRDYLNDISRSGNHVLSLVNDLLDISKIEAGAVEFDFQAVSLNEALTEAVAIMQPQANRERVIIRSSLTSRLPDIVADQRSVTQIALNLLSNAIRFTGPGGQVIISTSYEPSGDVLLRVRDTGIGMTRQEVEQALRPYKQITTPKHARTDGTGLGLPLTKAMAEANRASFSIDSTPGRGTMVEISFPSTRVLAD